MHINSTGDSKKYIDGPYFAVFCFGLLCMGYLTGTRAFHCQWSNTDRLKHVYINKTNHAQKVCVYLMDIPDILSDILYQYQVYVVVRCCCRMRMRRSEIDWDPTWFSKCYPWEVKNHVLGTFFLSLAWRKLRQCSANYWAGYFSNLACESLEYSLSLLRARDRKRALKKFE